ncbi:hypothetical protein OTBS_1340 [Orientia tsutsugamushi str. Boryong]|uniref:Uncharacterized protein n=2 Tax=Orientia tsutsugamushi TaxID=784 RepID=A5CEB5_ORITB|nr:hypothetical protein OTBS_1340 [Orientia tsutsugamushi str. Boryong]
MRCRSTTQLNIQAMDSIKLCRMLKDRKILSETIITEILNRALFLLQTEDTRYNRLQFDARGLATIVYQLAKLDYGISTEFLHAWTNKAINLIEDFIPQGLANSIWAFGHLGIKPSAQFIRPFSKLVKVVQNYKCQRSN